MSTFCFRAALAPRFVPALLLAPLCLAGLTPPAAAQDGCGDAAGYFQVNGQFYSSLGLVDWAQGDFGQGVFDDQGNPVLGPALHDRDESWAGNAKDPDAFSGNQNKNNDDISAGAHPWSWGSGSGPAKNDLTDVYAHSKELNGDIWLFLGALTRSNNGASHVDFEFNQQGFTKLGSTSGTIVGNGPDAGRTADVDFIVSVDFTDGGTVPEASFRIWRWTGSAYEFVTATPNPGDVFVCTNPTEVPAPPWGAVSTGGDVVDTVAPYQFVEIGLNLTGLGIDPRVFCSDVSTLLFKTRSAPSFTSELKDFGLYRFSIVAPPACTISAQGHDVCAGGSLELCAPEPPAGSDLTYAWDGPGGPYPDQRCLTVSQTGTYSLRVTDNLSGCSSDACTYDVTVHPLPSCAITADTDVVCAGTAASFCGPEGNYDYDWSGPGGPYGNQRCISVTEAGTYRLTVTDRESGCSSSGCERTLTVNPVPPCGITGPGLLCDGLTADLCAPEGNYDYAWSGPGGPYGNQRCITVTEAGTYRLTVTDRATGCATGPCEHQLLVADNPGCLISGPPSICPGGEEQLCGPEGNFAYAWTGPGGSYPNQRCITVTEPGDYSLTLMDPNGCSSTCEHTLTADDPVTAGTLEDLFICTGERAEWCVTPSGTGPITYQWFHDGASIPGATDACFAIPAIDAGDVGTYRVEVTGKCNTVSRSADLALADVGVAPLKDLYLCDGQPARFCAEPSGRGPFTYRWFKDGSELLGKTDRCLEFDAVTHEDEGRYCVMVTGACGPPAQACAYLYVGDCVEYCGLTQGFYGNPGGKWNGLTTIQLLDQLITPESPLTVGVMGTRSVTFEEGSEHCIIDWLPAGGPSLALPEDVGDVVVDPVDCRTTPRIQGAKGRIHNSLLAQTLTLSLNTRLDPNLPDLPLCELVIMIPILPGPDGIRGTADDVPDNEHPRIIHVAPEVFQVLDLLSLPHTAGGALALANLALAGSLPDGVPLDLGDVTGAVGSVNDLVDECALTIHCADTALSRPEPGTERAHVAGGSGDAETGAAAAKFAVTSPNPIRGASGVRVTFSLPEPSRARLVLYDLAGRRVAATPAAEFDAGIHGWEVGQEPGRPLATGMYFIRLEGTALDSGKRLSLTAKVLVLR